MQMTDSEIVRSYKQAENKKEQISILADLNGCPQGEIINILKSQGAELPKSKDKVDLKSETEKIKKMIKEGKSQGDVAKHYGVSQAKISYLLKDDSKKQSFKAPKEVIKQILEEAKAMDDRFTELKTKDEVENEHDSVNHPSHYCVNGIECLDVMKEVFGADKVQAFCVLNSFKYLFRFQRKNGEEDIKKAHFYLSRYIELMEKESVEK